MGIALYIAKLASLHLLLDKAKWLKRLIYKNSFTLFLFDGIFGFLGSHVMAGASGSLIAVIGAITFALISIFYIYSYLFVVKPIQQWNLKRKGIA